MNVIKKEETLIVVVRKRQSKGDSITDRSKRIRNSRQSKGLR